MITVERMRVNTEKCTAIKGKRNKCRCKATFVIAVGRNGDFRLSTMESYSCDKHLPYALRKAAERDKKETALYDMIDRNKLRKDYKKMVEEHGRKMEDREDL